MLLLILSVGLATAISAFCSVSEAALYSISWAKIEGLRKDGKRSGDILFKLRQDVQAPITAILTLNTVANTAGASVAGAAFTNAIGAEFLGLFAVAFTLIILTLSEIIPKTIGVVYAPQVAPLLARPLMVMVVFMRPAIWLSGFLVRLVTSRKGEPHTTEDDIRAIVSLTRRAGVLKPFEEMSIRNILTLDTKLVKNIMTPRMVVFSLPADMTVKEAKDSHSFWSHSRIPVFEGDDREDVIGLVYRREVVRALAEDRHESRLGDILKPVEFVLENLTLDRLLVKFLESRLHLMVVLDEFGGVAGVVTLEDVMEEILGKEIVDETDTVVDMRELARQRRAQTTKKER
jgi:CBS domain containing-hemolysin-like protein